MEILSNLLAGLHNTLLPMNILFLLIGILTGEIIGILPGLGPVTGIALLAPMTYGMDPIPALIMLAGVYYGAMFGGSLTSIMFNIPGDAAAVVVTFDGYPLTKQGKSGLAIASSMTGSFTGGVISIVWLIFLAPVMAKVALAFGPVEYTALIFVSLLLVVGLTSGSKIKSTLAILFGLLLSLIGQDPISGTPRFTFGFLELLSGVDFVVVALGLFAVGEIIKSVVEYDPQSDTSAGPMARVKQVMLTRKELRKIAPSLGSGTVIGFLTGLLPGAGATIATFLSYGFSKKVSKTPDIFGKGSIEGIAAAESAASASVSGAMAPMLTLGIPGSNSTAVLLGSMMILGLQPGPLFFSSYPDTAWAVIASMLVGTVLLFILNMSATVRIFLQILRVPFPILATIIIVLAFLGGYSAKASMFDVYLMGIFGVVGYCMKQNDYPIAPMLLTLVLGSLLEQNLRRALTISDGSYTVFLTSPISLGLLLVGLAGLAVPPIIKYVKRKRLPNNMEM